MTRYLGLVLAIALMLGGGTASVAQTPAPLIVQLTPQSESGETGIARLTEEGSKTKVVVEITGAPAGVGQPLHIHKGTCATLDPQPAYGLATLTNGKSETTVDAPLTYLRTAPFAINGHKSAEDVKTYVFCGNIPTP